VTILLLSSGPGTLSDYSLDKCGPAGRFEHRVIPLSFYDPVTTAATTAHQ
jgi:hypothetical protein